jgi:hypothetical protein
MRSGHSAGASFGRREQTEYVDASAVSRKREASVNQGKADGAWGRTGCSGCWDDKTRLAPAKNVAKHCTAHSLQGLRLSARLVIRRPVTDSDWLTAASKTVNKGFPAGMQHAW